MGTNGAVSELDMTTQAQVNAFISAVSSQRVGLTFTCKVLQVPVLRSRISQNKQNSKNKEILEEMPISL
jgi:hypothetical protein